MSDLSWSKDEYTPKPVAEWLEISIVSLHNWSKEYAEFLSQGANNTTADGRTYTRMDCVVLWTIWAMREQKYSHAQIKAKITDGTRIEPNTTPDAPGEPILTVFDKSMTELDALQKELEVVKVERDTLQQRLDNVTAQRDADIALRDAQINALEGEIKSLQQQMKAQRREHFEQIRELLQGDNE